MTAHLYAVLGRSSIAIRCLVTSSFNVCADSKGFEELIPIVGVPSAVGSFTLRSGGIGGLLWCRIMGVAGLLRVISPGGNGS